MMHREGVIKFNQEWIKAGPPRKEFIQDLIMTRQKLFNLGLIGKTEDGIGFGNLSKRESGNRFIISGSGTGILESTSDVHYTLVSEYDIKANSLISSGPVLASSESLTHAVLYEFDSNINAVIHVHHKKLWEMLLLNYPSTGKHIEYGTVEMALDIRRLLTCTGAMKNKFFAMAGHEDGIIAFGDSVNNAEKIIIDLLARL